MIDVLVNSPLFFLTVCCIAWHIGLQAQKKTGWRLCYPLVIASLLIIGLLLLLDIPYQTFKEGTAILYHLLTPATAVLALNIYRQRTLLGKYFFPVVAGCLAGSVTSIVSVLALCRLFNLNEIITASLIPKSVTSAIALAISENMGGYGGITTAAAIVAGTIGAIYAPLLARVFKVTHPIAEGAAIGACSHALGTTKALEIGELQGAMSSISICICGIITSFLVLFIH